MAAIGYRFRSVVVARRSKEAPKDSPAALAVREILATATGNSFSGRGKLGQAIEPLYGKRPDDSRFSQWQDPQGPLPDAALLLSVVAAMTDTSIPALLRLMHKRTRPHPVSVEERRAARRSNAAAGPKPGVNQLKPLDSRVSKARSDLEKLKRAATPKAKPKQG